MSENQVRATLYKKIAAVMGASDRVPKRGRNKFHNYDYATEADLVESLRGLLAEQGLAFLVSVVSQERIPSEMKAGDFTRVELEFTLACADTGESVSCRMWGEGQDPGDKGLYKAYTGAVKYFLMKTFLIPTGDDPEADQMQQEPKPARQAQTKHGPVDVQTGELRAAPKAEPSSDPARAALLQDIEEAQATIAKLGGKPPVVHKPEAMTMDALQRVYTGMLSSIKNLEAREGLKPGQMEEVDIPWR